MSLRSVDPAQATTAARASALVVLAGVLVIGAVLLLGPSRLLQVTLSTAHELTKTTATP